MKIYAFFTLLLAFILLASLSACQKGTNKRSANERAPNIVLIYVDDLGYGDVSCYGATTIKTPNVDRLAAGGVKFTDGHCSAATCTPSRYALLTGEYAFRNNAAILPGDAPLIIDPQKLTLPSMLKEAGYATAVIGKWHLGLGNGQVDWNQAVSPGPLEIGFDYSFLIPATGDRVPTVYLEDHHVVNLDPADPINVSYRAPIEGVVTGLSNPELLRFGADTQHSATIVNGVSRIGYMSGGASAHWKDEDFPRLLDQKAKAFMKANEERPFFLYYSFHDIHVPRLPHPDFEGQSNMGPRGDAILQMDWMVGEIIVTLEQLGIAEETMIIFTSDNGPVLNDGYEDWAEEKIGDHRPSGPFRGGKYSAFEAGTRVPTIVYWPGKIKPAESAALVSQVDLMASLGELIKQSPERLEHLDSQAMLATWLGEEPDGRTWLVEESYTLSLREGSWKYIRPISQKRPTWLAAKNIEGGFEKEAQLYDLAADPGEKENLAAKIPEKVDAMEQKLQAIERSTK